MAARDQNLAHVIVETDSLWVAQQIYFRQPGTSGFHLLLRDCLSILDSLNNAKIVLARSSANQIVHCLARASGSMLNTHLLGNSVPIFFVCNFSL